VSPTERRARFLWPLVAVLGAFVYLFSLDGLYIPHIGDEAPYIEIARLTAESGSWLPLKTGSGLENTKPPLLYWLGIVATDWGSNWTLFRLRVPVVLFTFATAVLTFWLSRKLGYERETAWISALTFLGFYSSFQYGRPFLINSPETFFVFLSFALPLGFRESWFAAGIALGIACLFKSFALVAPVGLAFVWVGGRRRLFPGRRSIREGQFRLLRGSPQHLGATAQENLRSRPAALHLRHTHADRLLHYRPSGRRPHPAPS